jgi:ABC-type lipoprotein export system ATPase subunit
MLELRNVSKSYIQRGIVLDSLNLKLAAGDSIAIMGPSGSGKTTLMNIIGLVDRPDKGDILFMGNPVTGYTDKEAAHYRNRNVGFVFQDHMLIPYLTVFENILLPLMASDEPDNLKNEKVLYAENLMKRTGIDSLRDKLPSRISGGEAQRTALIRALVNKPALLLADEPTGSLDSKNALLLAELLAELNSQAGISLILSTHSQVLAEKMSVIYRLENGKLVTSN